MGLPAMQVSDVAVKFFRPEAAPPFVNLYRLTPKAAILNRNPQHRHPDTIEIFAVFHGHLDWIVAGESYNLRPGDVMIIPPKVVHGAADANLQACDVIALHIAPEELPSSVRAAADSLGPARTRDLAILEMVRRIFDEHRRKNPLLPEVAAALSVLLVSSLIDLGSDTEAVENSRLVQRAQRALMEKSGFRRTVQEVADGLGVSPVWLTQCFVRETGTSPGEWARSKRIAEAKRLLAESELSTSEIAFELGYSSGQVLATTFRKECGFTPSEFRALHRDGRDEPVKPVSYSMRIFYLDGDERIGDDN